MKAKFGSAAYAVEELRAELSHSIDRRAAIAYRADAFPRIATDHDQRTRDGNRSPVEQLGRRSCLLGRRSR